MKQVESGKAFEYGIAKELSNVLECSIENNSSLDIAKSCFENVFEEERNKISQAAKKAVDFLCEHDNNLTENLMYHDVGNNFKVALQSDAEGKRGDVRDIIIYNLQRNLEIGLSLKNRHAAVKHSRLSEKISFGKIWLGVDNSEIYKNEISPIFTELRERRFNMEEWKNIPDKKTRFYKPLLLI